MVVGNEDRIQPGSDSGADLLNLARSGACGTFLSVDMEIYFKDGDDGGPG